MESQEETKRKLASIQRVVDVKKHPNADTLDLITVLGWQVVNKSGQLKVGDFCVFFEIDSILPKKPQFEFLEKTKYRIKTCKLRGEVSQGLVMPISILESVKSDELVWDCDLETMQISKTELNLSSSDDLGLPNPVSTELIPIEEGLDVTRYLGVEKYDREIQFWAKLGSQAKGNFPCFLSKTDAIRFQSLSRRHIEEFHGVRFAVSLKMDGTSFTCYLREGEFGVCSRNLELKPSEDTKSVYWFIAKKYELEAKLRKFVEDNDLNISNIAIQGEICGPSIQKNPLRLTEPELFVFDVFDISSHSYLTHDNELRVCDALELPHVQIFDTSFVFDLGTHSVSYFLEMAKGNYFNTDNPREGLVFKAVNNNFSEGLRDRMKFKIINNEYLLKTE